MSFRTKLADLIAGTKSINHQYTGGKTYFTLSDLDSSSISKYMGALNCTYTPYSLINLFYSVSEVFSPIDAIARRVSMAKWTVKSVKDDSVIYDNKYLNRLMVQPNPLQNWQQFIYESIVWELVNGANFIYANNPDTMAFDYKNIATLQNLFTYNVQVVLDTKVKLLSATEIGDIVKAYRLVDYVDIAPERVLFNQFMSLNQADNKVYGKSPLLSAQKALANLIAVYEARGSIYLNRGALGMFVSKATDQAGTVPLTPDEKEEAEKDYLKAHGFGKGQRTIAISGQPLEWQRIGMSIAELLPFEETQADAAAIYAVLNVPQDLMPTPKGATFENQRMAERALYQNVATPMAKSRAQALTNFLQLDKVGLYIDASHDHIEVLQDNRKEKAETDKILNESLLIQYRCGVITMNEWIAKTGGTPIVNPLYDKRTLEMDPEEVQRIIPLLTAKSNTGGNIGANQ